MRRFVGLSFGLLLAAMSVTGVWAAPPGYYEDQK